MFKIYQSDAIAPFFALTFYFVVLSDKQKVLYVNDIAIIKFLTV